MKQLLLFLIVIQFSFLAHANGEDSKNTTSPSQPIKTIVVEPNVIKGERVLSQKMLNSKNTNYILKYECDLGGKTIIVPENSSLVFEGGIIKNGAVDFTNSSSSFIYSSWMDTETLLNSVKYMSYKTLVIDKDLTIDQPIGNKGEGNLNNFSIKGVDANNRNDVLKSHVRIFCKNCSAIDVSGYNNSIKDLSFLFSEGGNDNAFIKLDTQGPGVSDLDAVIDNCSFYTDDHTTINSFAEVKISNAIVTYGRGLKVQNCTFNGAVKDAYIKCFMKTDTWRSNPEIDVTDKYGGRAFWIHHNRIHMHIARLVHFAINKNAPNCVFRGIRIENNLADVGGSLGLFEAPSYNTYITDNTFLGGVHYSLEFLTFIDANELKIENNIFRAFDNKDRVSFMSSDYCIRLRGDKFNELKDLSFCNNLVSSKQYFIEANVPLNGLNVSDNMFNDQSFTGEQCAVLRSIRTTKNAIVSRNISSSTTNTRVDCFRAFESLYPNEILSDITIADNLGCTNWITSFGDDVEKLKGCYFQNINIKYDLTESPEKVMDKCSFIINVKSKKGFSYVDSTLSPATLVLWDGTKWVEQDGAIRGVKRRGPFRLKPEGSDVYIGFSYYCTDRKTAEGKSNGIVIYWNGKSWTDALGRIVK